MAITVNINRQTRLSAYVDFTIADIKPAGTFNAIHLPAGAVVLGGFLDVLQDVNAGTSYTLSVGDSVGSSPDVDKYLVATDVNGTNAKIVKFTLPPKTNGAIPAGGAWVTVTGVSAGTEETEGRFRLSVEYIVEDRVTEYEPYRG